MGDFDKAVRVILHHEGGYVNDGDDPGGETKYGISQKAYPQVNIAMLTREQAMTFYREDYWDKIRGDEIENPQLAVQVFDMAVNAGVRTAVELLQKASDTIVDGKFGPVTMKAVNGYPRRFELVWRYKYERACYYAKLVARNTKLTKFLTGWINRVESTNIYTL